MAEKAGYVRTYAEEEGIQRRYAAPRYGSGSVARFPNTDMYELIPGQVSAPAQREGGVCAGVGVMRFSRRSSVCNFVW